MEQAQLEKFNPTIADLEAMVAKTKSIQTVDIKDKEQLKMVKENRIELGKARVAIAKYGKALREDAVKFQRDVIAKEKELIGIIEPEEERLVAFEEEAKRLALMEERERKLPERVERLNGVTDAVEWEKNSLLEMDDVQFEAFYNKAVADENARKQKEIEKEQKAREAELAKREAEVKEEERRIAEKKHLEEEKEKARLEGERKAKEEAERRERERVEAEERKAREAKEAAERAEREKQEEAERLERDKKFKAFLKENGWTEATRDEFDIRDNGSEVVLFKKLGTFKK